MCTSGRKHEIWCTNVFRDADSESAERQVISSRFPSQNGGSKMAAVKISEWHNIASNCPIHMILVSKCMYLSLQNAMNMLKSKLNVVKLIKNRNNRCLVLFCSILQSVGIWGVMFWHKHEIWWYYMILRVLITNLPKDKSYFFIFMP